MIALNDGEFGFVYLSGSGNETSSASEARRRSPGESIASLKFVIIKNVQFSLNAGEEPPALPRISWCAHESCSSVILYFSLLR